MATGIWKGDEEKKVKGAFDKIIICFQKYKNEKNYALENCVVDLFAVSS